MTRRPHVALLVTSLLFFVGLASARGNDETELKERFKERYSTLMQLKDAQKVGETFIGYADAVEANYLSDSVDPNDDKATTIATFLAEENADRTKLYRLIAKRTSTKEEDVAKRNARRLFLKARPNHFLRLSDGAWVQKKDLKKSE